MKLKEMPSAEVIKGLGGVIDFYLDHGQVIARRWPSKIKFPPSPGATCNQHRFRTFMKDWKYFGPSVPNMDRGFGKWTGWRSIDFAYRRYMGKTHLAPRFDDYRELTPIIPCPDPGGLMYRVHAAYWQVHRTTNYPHDHPLWPDQPRYFWFIVFWTVDPWLQFDIIFSYDPPGGDFIDKRERGGWKPCAWTPRVYTAPQVWCLNWPMYGESPPVTHYYAFSFYPDTPTWSDRWCYMTLCQHEYPWWEPYLSISIGPFFKLRDPRPAPWWLDVGEDAWHYIDSQFPVHKPKPRNPKWIPIPTPWEDAWVPGLIMNRPPNWPEVTLPPDVWVHLTRYYRR